MIRQTSGFLGSGFESFFGDCCSCRMDVRATGFSDWKFQVFVSKGCFSSYISDCQKVGWVDRCAV